MRWLKRGLLILVILIVAVVVFFAARQALAQAEVNQALQAPVARVGDIGTTQKLEVIPLLDGDARDPALVTQPGVSYLVRTDQATILFDVGFNPANETPSPVERNMARLGVSLDEVTHVVISHHHPDHTGSLAWWQQGTFSLGMQQASLTGRSVFVPQTLTYPGVSPVVSQAPTRLAPGVATTGTIPFANPFPVNLFSPAAAEQALVINVAGQGLVIITGCGHPSLETLVARTQTVYDVPLVGVVGGLHYQGANAQALQPHITFLQGLQPRLVSLSPHDSGPAAIAAFQAAFPNAYRDLLVGEKIILPGS